jgi:hypothetical protein
MSSNEPSDCQNSPAPTKRKRGAPAGNQNRRRHGLYAKPPKPIQGIDDLVADALTKHSTLSAYIEEHGAEMNVEEMTKLLALYGQNASRLGRLLRDKRALSGDAADGLLSAIGKALDELTTELGVTL